MGVIDKIKNALFEVEYVEVDEPPKKEKKEKIKKKEKEKHEKVEKPIAKKIVLPGKREEKVEELQEEELRDEDFEIRPKNENVKESVREEFKFMDDNDFKVDEEVVEQPEIVHVFDEHENARHAYEDVRPTFEKPTRVVTPAVQPETRPVETAPMEETYNRPSYNSAHESKPYGVDNSYKVPVHEYGTYERKEERSYFKPSPIISPIYGILDKNYKKEDVKEKKDVRISSYSRTNVSVDDIRNKAYGEEKKEEEVKEDTTKFEVEEEDDNLLVDLSDRAKPEVKELTVGDAVEYFQDLGLEYNVDYVDVSKEKGNAKKIKVEEETTSQESKKEIQDAILETTAEEAPKHSVKVEDESGAKASTKEEDNDNLFDLIDSMYQEDH